MLWIEAIKILQQLKGCTRRGRIRNIDRRKKLNIYSRTNRIIQIKDEYRVNESKI